MGPDQPTGTTISGAARNMTVHGGANFMLSNMGPDRPVAASTLGRMGIGAAWVWGRIDWAASTGAGGVVGPERP